ncbi:MAG: class I SAM-dependent DNA methyltransferase, partial [Deltaproteobacteria bacterium]|nr:class I SAM-dependent DNA methyltransferase [Deltaproteobacteria bacterium]
MSFKRRVLSALGKEELLEIGRGLDLEVTAAMRVDDLRDVIAKSKRASVPRIVQESMSRDTLKAICVACGLDDTSKEKGPLVERIVTAAGNGSGTYKIDPEATRGSIAREGSTVGLLLPGFEIPGKPPTKAKRRRQADSSESEAVVSGSLKAALRQFAIEAAGGFRGREATLSFTTRLLQCFGWSDGRPEGAHTPRTFSVAENGQRADREIALWWPERRTMMEVASPETVLDYAWKDLLRICLQLDPTPQYVVLTNQRDLQLYDLAGNHEAWRLSIPIDDLPKQSDAFPFFMTDWRPGATPRIINSDKVSKAVAELVAKVYRSVLAQYPKREDDVIRFTLQCITAMFAEDIGLLPRNYFTSLLYVGAQQRDVEARLRELFVQMNTRDLAQRVVPYFNGGLFTKIETLPLGSAQLMALTEAAQANWTHVDPHIFGSVFQNIMGAEERHASGAHYTAHDDIMRVVGPTIVEPWRKRIQAATTLKELTELRAELFRFKVLDPACGSGNFLYIAFRELYALDTELLTRMLRDFPSTHGKLSWSGGIPATNFYGFDINRFAVELAKVTLNIAKKKAFEERKEKALTFHGQVEMDTDPSLPLDNLDDNIVVRDALFTDWPQVDAIVGNPPFLAGLDIRSELGPDYLEKLKKRYPGVNGRADFCSFWFRRAHDHLGPNKRAGLVATSSIREGNSREAATDYIVENGGTITNAVSSQPWPGLAVVNVSMVNWVKGAAEGEPRRLVIDGAVFEPKVIPPTLQLDVNLTGARALNANDKGTSQGLVLGTKEFQFESDVARELRRDKRARRFIKPVAVASHMLRGKLSTE